MTDALYNLDESQSALCPELYARLLATCGSVVIANQGESMAHISAWDAGRRSYYTQVMHSGEYYRVNCPFCNDTKHRLWVNHMYNQPDASGRSMRFLATCYNEDCLSDFENWRRFNDALYGFRNAADRRRQPFYVRAGTVIETNPGPAQMPGRCEPISSLYPEHPAVRYMVGDRRYTMAKLAKYNISYCASALPQYREAQNRIVFPIFMEGILVGWQCRYIGSANWGVTPKYYGLPGMRKRTMLYNFDNARDKPFVVVVEGPTDVHAIGDTAVAVMGKHLSRYQISRLVDTWDLKPIILIFDPDAREEMRASLNDLANIGRNPVVEVELPDGFDPGDYDQATIHNIIHARARERGVILPHVM